MQKTKGNIAEAAVIYHLSKLGLPVFKELGDSSSVDLITLINKKPITIQVKYAEVTENNSISLNLRKTGPGGYVYYYKESDFDLFALYIANTEQVIWITSKEALVNRNNITFRLSHSKKNNQHNTTRMIEDYLNLFEVLNR